MKERKRRWSGDSFNRKCDGRSGSCRCRQNFITTLTEVNAVSPARSGASGRPMCWAPEDIVKAFALKIESDKYAKEYPRSSKSTGVNISYLRRKISGWKMNGYRNFVRLPEWKKVTQEAKKLGMDFGKTPFAYQPSKP